MVLKNKYKEIARTSLTAKAIFYLLRGRERNRKNMNLARLRTDVRHILALPLRDTEFMSTMRELEHVGAGKIHYGVRGAPKYFSWDVPITEVARLAEVTEDEFKHAQSLVDSNKPAKAYNLPRITGGVRSEAEVKTSVSNMKSHIVFVFPDGSIKKLDLSSEISDSTLTELAKVLIRDSFVNISGEQRKSNEQQRIIDKSDMPSVQDQ